MIFLYSLGSDFGFRAYTSYYHPNQLLLLIFIENASAAHTKKHMISIFPQTPDTDDYGM